MGSSLWVISSCHFLVGEKGGSHLVILCLCSVVFPNLDCNPHQDFGTCRSKHLEGTRLWKDGIYGPNLIKLKRISDRQLTEISATQDNMGLMLV